MKVSADTLSNLNTEKKLGCCEWLEQGAALSKCGDKPFYHDLILFNRSKHFCCWKHEAGDHSENNPVVTEKSLL
jgi:hypothetical protein